MLKDERDREIFQAALLGSVFTRLLEFLLDLL